MAISQNARFSGEAAPDAEFEHPPGASIARLLQAGLVQRGWKVSDIENWRDSGWSISCCRAASTLEVVIAKVAIGSEWFMQIAPSYVPSLLGRVLSKPASALPEPTQDLAMDVYSVLTEAANFRSFRWRWDGDPEEGSSTPEPVRTPSCS